LHRQRHPERGTEFASDPPEVIVAADVGYVAQILSNLLENAERYSPAAERILVETALEGDYVVIRIIDHGPNVGAAEHDLIFRPFAPPVAGPRRGPGAGLAASKRLVEAHGGRIWTQPSASGGTEFGFTLPIASEGGRDGQ
jgi:signal transduction histidine kinase